MSSSLEVRRATLADLPLVAPLFDAYRQFYGQPSNFALAESFLRDRLSNNESVIFVAIDRADGGAVGFTQLYPSFTSVGCRRIWILNDLFVAGTARRRGVGRALLQKARDFAVATGARRLVLSTAVTNSQARALYESFGYVLDNEFLTYKLEL